MKIEKRFLFLTSSIRDEISQKGLSEGDYEEENPETNTYSQIEATDRSIFFSGPEHHICVVLWFFHAMKGEYAIADRIKEITIELDGDMTMLSSAPEGKRQTTRLGPDR